MGAGLSDRMERDNCSSVAAGQWVAGELRVPASAWLDKIAYSSCHALVLLLLVTGVSPNAATQTTKTVRHHRVQDGDPDAAKLTEAENDLAKRDYASAEPILKDIVA